jgi:hypothetical protein
VPRENLGKLTVEEVDTHGWAETLIASNLRQDQDFADQKKAMRHVIEENRDVLRRLAE